MTAVKETQCLSFFLILIKNNEYDVILTIEYTNFKLLLVSKVSINLYNIDRISKKIYICESRENQKYHRSKP